MNETATPVYGKNLQVFDLAYPLSIKALPASSTQLVYFLLPGIHSSFTRFTSRVFSSWCFTRFVYFSPLSFRSHLSNLFLRPPNQAVHVLAVLLSLGCCFLPAAPVVHVALPVHEGLVFPLLFHHRAFPQVYELLLVEEGAPQSSPQSLKASCLTAGYP
jgi:hypothetical protein